MSFAVPGPVSSGEIPGSAEVAVPVRRRLAASSRLHGPSFPGLPLARLVSAPLATGLHEMSSLATARDALGLREREVASLATAWDELLSLATAWDELFHDETSGPE